jgi:hypothetical protein
MGYSSGGGTGEVGLRVGAERNRQYPGVEKADLACVLFVAEGLGDKGGSLFFVVPCFAILLERSVEAGGVDCRVAGYGVSLDEAVDGAEVGIATSDMHIGMVFDEIECIFIHA